MKQTSAVEWLQVQLNENGKLSAVDFYQAKQMEKQKIIEAFYEGMRCQNFDPNMGRAEQYYNETFNNKEK